MVVGENLPVETGVDEVDEAFLEELDDEGTFTGGATPGPPGYQEV